MWIIPKEDWTIEDGVTFDDFNRIEGNSKYLHTNVFGAKRPATIVVGSSAAGHTAGMVDYLCTGVSDNTVISAAITALPDTGGTILFLSATYNINAALTVSKSNVVLLGCGGTKFLRAFNDSNMLTISGVGCTIQGIIFDGIKATYLLGNSVSITGYSCTITNCSFINAKGYDIVVGSSYAKILNNMSIDNGKAFVYCTSTYATINSNTIRTGVNGIVLASAQYSSVDNNGLICTGNCIEFDLCNDCSITNNKCYGAYVGIIVTGGASVDSKGVIVTNNICVECATGIYVLNVYNIIVSSNTVRQGAYTSAEYSIYCNTLSYALITNNMLPGKAVTVLAPYQCTVANNIS